MNRDEYLTLMDHVANFTEVLQNQFQEKDWPDEPVQLPTKPPLTEMPDHGFPFGPVWNLATYRDMRVTKPIAFLARKPSTSEGTFGNLQCCLGDRNAEFATLELPWLANRRDVSCIPAGNYRCEYRTNTGKRIGGESRWYEVQNVDGRDGILIHPGNWAGDEALGMYSDTRGCILVGYETELLHRPRLGGVEEVRKKQMGVTRSRDACRELAQFFGHTDFKLRIYDA